MSLAQLRNEIGKALLGGIMALLMGILLAVVTGAWSLKESKADHDTDYLRLESKLDRVLDIACDATRQAPHACTNQYPIYPRP